MRRTTMHDSMVKRAGLSVCTSHACGSYLAPFSSPPVSGATNQYRCPTYCHSQAHNLSVRGRIVGAICGIIEDC